MLSITVETSKSDKESTTGAALKCNVAEASVIRTFRDFSVSSLQRLKNNEEETLE